MALRKNLQIIRRFTRLQTPCCHHSLVPIVRNILSLRSSNVTLRHISSSVGFSSQANVGFNHNTDSDITIETLRNQFNLTWLRENCTCSQCLNQATRQRNILPHLLDESLQVTDLSVQNNTLTLTWNDGHRSVYNFDQLTHLGYPGRPQPHRTLWNGSQLQESPVKAVPYTDYISGEAGLSAALQNLIDYGIVFVNGAEASVEGTKAAVERMAPVMETFFGGMWNFTSNMEEHKDTAYTNIELGPHNDGTYFTLPPGLQVFQCLQAGSGGETVLVDGFKAAQQLQETDPEAFNTLATTQIHHHYHEPGIHMNSLDRIIKTHPVSGDLTWIRYNHYDRSPIDTIPQGELTRFYRALNKLSAIVEHPEMKYCYKLTPGTVLFIDNWRVMHGRAAFTGKRVMSGCYVNRDDWMSRARTLGLCC